MANIQKLRESLQDIKNNPEKWDQAEYCGSAFCIAGWRYHRDFPTKPMISKYYWKKGGLGEKIRKYAAKAFELTKDQERDLFRGSNTLRKLTALINKWDREDNNILRRNKNA